MTRRDENGNITSFNYDGKNNVAAVVNALGVRTSLTYDPTFNKVATITDPLGRTRTFSYDGHGNLTDITHQDGSRRTIGSSGLGLPASVTDENANLGGRSCVLIFIISKHIMTPEALYMSNPVELKQLVQQIKDLIK